MIKMTILLHCKQGITHDELPVTTAKLMHIYLQRCPT